MRKIRLPSLRIRREGVAYGIAGLLALVMVVAVIWMLTGQAAAIDRNRANYETLLSEYKGLYSEAITEGVNPSAPPPDDVPAVDDQAPEIQIPIPGPSGAPGETGDRGPGPTNSQVLAALGQFCEVNDCRPSPTISQVAAAISDFCAEGECRGPEGERGENSEVPGPQGDPGRPPTSEEIATAVAAYCTAGSCRGEDGEDGEDAPPPSDEQVRAQVATYCAANNDCQGPQGDRGAQGEAGKFEAGDYTCPDETPYMRGFSVQENGDWSVACEAFPPGTTTPES